MGGQNPPLRKGEKLPEAHRKYEARAAVGHLRAGAHTSCCARAFPLARSTSGLFLGSFPRLTPPPEGGWYVLDDSKSLKRAREGGFLRFGLD